MQAFANQSRGSLTVRRMLATALLAGAFTPSIKPSVVHAQESSASSTQASSLYERLGKYDGVQKYVALVFPRVAQHPQLRRMFQGHGADSQQKQFQHVVELICNRTGGPCVYTAREMPTVHIGLGITPADWNVFMQIIDQGMDEMKYPADVRAEFRKLWESFRGSVVEP